MNSHFSVRVLAMGVLLAITPMQTAWAKAAPAAKPPALGQANAFAILGGEAVTCTNGAITTGNVGISSPGTASDYTNTTCPVSGDVPPATDAAADAAHSAFTRTYDSLITRKCIQPTLTGTLDGAILAPGVYCLSAEAKTGNLTLSGPANGVWIFHSIGALTGSSFTVTMSGGKACNVWWVPNDGVTMTDSSFQGNILAGDIADGSISLTGGTLTGRALANVAVTTTDTVVTLPAAGRTCPR